MNRPIIYSLEQIRSFDSAWGWKDDMYGLAALSQDMLGSSETVITRFPVTQTSPASLSLISGVGDIYQISNADSTPYGPLPSDSTQIMQQGYAPAGTLNINPPSLTAGQSVWALIECAFAQVDAIRANDPNGGVLPYVNVNNPGQPLQGPNDSGEYQNTVRQSVMVVTLKYGTPATSGSNTPPTVDANNAPAYLINLAYGQTTITTGEVLTAGPGAFSGYQQAPFFPGIIGTVAANPSGSHHGGIAGQANKILLTNGAEVQGILSFPQLPVTNASPPAVGGIVSFAGEIPIESQGSGSPSGTLAGMQGDLYFDLVQLVLWVCTSSGSSSSAIWQQVGTGGISRYVNTSPYTVIPGNITYLVDTTGGNIEMVLPPSNTMGGTGVGFKNIGTNQVIILPQTGEFIESNANGVAMTLFTEYQFARIWPRSSHGWYLG